MPPLDAVSTPRAFRVPVAGGRSPLAIGPPLAPPHVVQPFAKTPLMPSEMTPTRTPVPSMDHWLRTASLCRMASPSDVTAPTRRLA